MQVPAIQQQSQGEVVGNIAPQQTIEQNSMHCTTRQVTPHQARGPEGLELEEGRVTNLGSSAILGRGQGLMKPNLGGRLPQGQGERGTAGWPGVVLPLASNRPPANERHGLLTRANAQAGLANTKGHGTSPESVRRECGKGGECHCQCQLGGSL